MEISANPNYWQDYATDIFNGNKDRDATLEGYTSAMEAVQTLQAGGAVSLDPQIVEFLEQEGFDIQAGEQITADDLNDLDAALVDQHEQVSLANAIAEGLEDQVVRKITATLAERRSLFENEEEFI